MAISIVFDLIECLEDLGCKRCTRRRDAMAISHQVCHFFCQEYTDFLNDLYERYDQEGWDGVFQTDQLPSGRRYWSPEQATKIIEALVLANVQMSNAYWRNKLDQLMNALTNCIELNVPMYLDYDI